MKVYISCPISGRNLEEVRMQIKHAADLLREQGHSPVSPLEVSPGVGSTYAEHMGLDIQALMECDAICLLTGWHESKGCQLEYEAAKIYRKKILFAS